MIEIYTDGACSPNPGKGGWGAYIIHPNQKTESLNGGRDRTTNNQMELMAPIEALKHFKSKESIKIYTDSQYVQKGITSWIHSWKRKDWKTAGRKPVKNVELWKQLDTQCKRHSVSWTWIKGHNGDHGNEEADRLAGLYVYGDLPQDRPIALSQRVSDLEEYVLDLEQRVSKIEFPLS